MSVSDAPQESPKPIKRSKKSSKSHCSDVGPSNTSPASDSESSKRKEASTEGEVSKEVRKKEKKKKERLEPVQDSGEEQSTPSRPEDDDAKKARKEKRRKERALEAVATPEDKSEEQDAVSPSEVILERKKVVKPKRTLTNLENGEDVAVEKGEKKRKRKKDRADGDKEAHDHAPQPKKKKRKNDTGLPDPTEDAALSEQARKALAYAHDQFNDPGSWKFNKARQNWLIRNLWSSEAIPDTHLPLLTRYLANVQGGVREALIKACKTALATPEAEVAELTTTTPAAEGEIIAPPKVTFAVEVDHAAIVKQARARAILDVLSSE